LLVKRSVVQGSSISAHSSSSLLPYGTNLQSYRFCVVNVRFL